MLSVEIGAQVAGGPRSWTDQSSSARVAGTGKRSVRRGVGRELYRVAYRILRDADAADDATQQALVAIWRELPKLRDPERFEAWAYRIVVRFAPPSRGAPSAGSRT